MRAPEPPWRRFRLPAVLLAVALLYGTLGYVVIERWAAFDAFYMTVTTIATVGFGEVHPLSTAGRTFTITLILFGVATMLYAFGIFAETLSEGHFELYRRRRRMERRIAGLRDHFIICGFGRMGTQVRAELESAGATHVVIDNNPEAVQSISQTSSAWIDGDASAEDVLRAAGIERARALVCTVDSDERAVYITLAARALNPGLYILSRAGRPNSVRRLELAGADRVVSPYRMAGHQMAEMALRPALVEVMDVLHHGASDIGVEEILVKGSYRSLGRTLGGAGIFGTGAARLLALRRVGGTLIVDPPGETVIEEGDLIVALGTVSELERTAALLQ